MRVLHVITGLGVGGAEHQLRSLLRHLQYECEVVTLANPGPVAAAIRGDGVTVHELLMRGNRDLSVLPRLVRLMRRGRYDVVHTHLYRAGLYGRLAARLARVPHVVATEHSLGDGIIEGRRITRGVKALYLAAERLGEMTIAVSGPVAGRLEAWGVPDRRISVVPNGIDSAAFRFDPALRRSARARLGIDDDALVIGGVGRLEPNKRFDLLIRASARLAGATVLLVGDGSERTPLGALAREVGARVMFTGAVPRVHDLLCAMDVFAAPSEQETFGLAVLEALACGLPAVYVTCPPLDELQNAVGRRVPATETALTAALRAEADRAGVRCPVPAVVAHYDIAQLAAGVGLVYQRLVGRAPLVSTRPLRSEGS
jgi:glycosyltransferase involved in cell wall biosynthesis